MLLERKRLFRHGTVVIVVLGLIFALGLSAVRVSSRHAPLSLVSSLHCLLATCDLRVETIPPAAAPLTVQLIANENGTPAPSPTQCAGNYTYTVSYGTIVSATTLVPGSQCSQCTVSVGLPFPFTYYDQTYGSANLSSDGNLQFLSVQTSNHTCLPGLPLGPALLPHWDEWLTTTQDVPCNPYFGTPCGIYTSMSGVAPSRIFNIEWRGRIARSNRYMTNFEIRLHESTGTVDFVYGMVSLVGEAASVGVQDGSTRFTQYSCDTWGSLWRGLSLSWHPPPCGPTHTPLPTETATFTPSPSLTPSSTASVPNFTSTSTSTPVTTATATTITTRPPASATPSPIPSLTPTLCPLPFSDVQSSDYFYQAVRSLYCAGVISGYSDNAFRPNNDTTRAQLTKIVVLAEGWLLYAPTTATFVDVPVEHPFFAYIETAYYRSIISGYSDGNFHPYSNITRGQLCKVVILAEQWPLYTPPTSTFTDVPRGHPFFVYIETAHDRGIVSGYSDLTFRPQSSATRGQIAKIVRNAVRRWMKDKCGSHASSLILRLPPQPRLGYNWVSRLRLERGA